MQHGNNKIRAFANILWYYAAGRFLPPARMLRRRKGQTTVEYMLMLASIAAADLLLIASFHKKILGGIFTIAGMVLGAGGTK